MNLKVLVAVLLAVSSWGQESQPAQLADSLRIAVTEVDTISSDSLQAVVYSDTVKPVGNAKRIDDMISYAKTFLGTPYHYAGTSPTGFDCSGFIYYVMGNFGFDVSRTSYSLAELGKTVKLSEIQPGDLMFFKGRNLNSTTVGHVAMVVEVNEKQIKLIHASTSRGVVMEDFNSSKYLIPRYLKSKRLDYGGN